MEEEELMFDELFDDESFNEDSIDPANPPADPANPPAPGSEDEEEGFEFEGLEDDPRFQDDPSNTPEPPKPGEGEEEEEGEESDNDAPVSESSIVETFLERYNIVGGELETEDGKKVKFSELKPEQQVNVLAQIVDSTRPSVEEELSIKDDEKALLAQIRESKMTVKDFMQKSAQEFSVLSSVENEYDAPDYKFEDMSNDKILELYVAANNEEATEEQIKDEVEHLKKSSLFGNTAESLRKNFISRREEAKAAALKGIQKEAEEVFTGRVKGFVDAAKSQTEIAGWKLSDTDRNDILEAFAERDASGKTEFDKVMADQSKAIQAMWYMKYGEAKFKELDTFYKSKLTEVYRKGITDGNSGKTVQQRFSKVKGKSVNKGGRQSNSDDQTLEDFLSES